MLCYWIRKTSVASIPVVGTHTHTHTFPGNVHKKIHWKKKSEKNLYKILLQHRQATDTNLTGRDLLKWAKINYLLFSVPKFLHVSLSFSYFTCGEKSGLQSFLTLIQNFIWGIGERLCHCKSWLHLTHRKIRSKSRIVLE